MDTDDLTDHTYKAILVEAEQFDPNLTLQFGLLSERCNCEADFILMSKGLIEKMFTYDMVDLDDIFFGAPPQIEDFHATLNKILVNISQLPGLATPDPKTKP